MEEHINRPIKAVIEEFPAVGTLLDEFGIGCVPCAVGSCLLGDVVNIHGLAPAQEAKLMGRIAELIGTTPTAMPSVAEVASEVPVQAGIKYSPPVKRLVDEHLLIKRFIAAVPEILKRLDLRQATGRQVILDGVYFIRTYADGFHHAKEEDILFGYADSSQEVIQVMLEDHVTARSHVRAIVKGVEEGDRGAVAEHLLAYAELLTEHIKREDEILYPWMDRALSITQVGELQARFDAADKEADPAAIERCRRFVEELEVSFTRARKEAM